MMHHRTIGARQTVPSALRANLGWRGHWHWIRPAVDAARRRHGGSAARPGRPYRDRVGGALRDGHHLPW